MSEKDMNPGKNIDQIRDLIFGEQIRDYDRHFKSLSKDIKSVKTSLDQSIAELAERLSAEESDRKKEMDTLSKKIESVDSHLRKLLSRMETRCNEEFTRLDDDKTDRLEMANLLVELSLRLKKEDLLEELGNPAKQVTDET